MIKGKFKKFKQSIKQKMISKQLCIYYVTTLLMLTCTCATFKQLDELIEQKFTDTTTTMRLSPQQKFSIPLNGRYISYSISYNPQSTSQCTFSPPSVQYKKLAQSNKIFQEQSQIISMLILPHSQKVFLSDPYFTIQAYSTDQHKLLHLLSPKTSLTQTKTLSTSVQMLTTEDEQYIYYLTREMSFVFGVNSFGTQVEKLDVQLAGMVKARYWKGFVFVLLEDNGIVIYKVDAKQHKLTKVQTVTTAEAHRFVDLQIDKQNQLIYVLTDSSVIVYSFEPSQFPNLESHQFKIIILHDVIMVNEFTDPSSSSQVQPHISLSLSQQISPSLFILFRQASHQNIIAQFTYSILQKQCTFLRYYKFQMEIKQVHIIQDVIVLVGDEILGMFPFGVDPRLIKEEFNGWFTMTNLQSIQITQQPYFVGVTNNAIQYGGLVFNQEGGLNCRFNQQSKIKSITFTGILTSCNNDQKQLYNSYCQYSKKFVIESMDFVGSSAVSSSIWLTMLVSTACIILGIIIMLIMHKKKQAEIKKLQLYFSEKRRTQLPQSSQR